jgi:hypothetical protein
MDVQMCNACAYVALAYACAKKGANKSKERNSNNSCFRGWKQTSFAHQFSLLVGDEAI